LDYQLEKSDKICYWLKNFNWLSDIGTTIWHVM